MLALRGHQSGLVRGGPLLPRGACTCFATKFFYCCSLTVSHEGCVQLQQPASFRGLCGPPGHSCSVSARASGWDASMMVMWSPKPGAHDRLLRLGGWGRGRRGRPRRLQRSGPCLGVDPLMQSQARHGSGTSGHRSRIVGALGSQGVQ